MYRKIILSLFIVLLLLLTAASGSAHNQPVVIPLNSRVAAFNGDQYLNISFADFVPAYETLDYLRPWSLVLIIPIGARGYINNQGGIAFGTYDAAVHLPNTAIISAITVFGSNDLITTYFMKRELATDSTPASIVTAQDSFTTYAGATTAVNNEVVNNRDYVYHISALLSNDARLYSIRIKYTIP